MFCFVCFCLYFCFVFLSVCLFTICCSGCDGFLCGDFLCGDFLCGDFLCGALVRYLPAIKEWTAWISLYCILCTVFCAGSYPAEYRQHDILHTSYPPFLFSLLHTPSHLLSLLLGGFFSGLLSCAVAACSSFCPSPVLDWLPNKSGRGPIFSHQVREQEATVAAAAPETGYSTLSVLVAIGKKKGKKRRGGKSKCAVECCGRKRACAYDWITAIVT